jgi:hypothetical protein
LFTKCAKKRRELRAFAHVKGGDPAALHKEPLVAQNLAYGPDLAAISQALPQRARPGITASIAKLWECQKYGGEAMDVAAQRLRRLIRAQMNSEGRISSEKRVAFRLKARKRNADGAIGRDIPIRDGGEFVMGD